MHAVPFLYHRLALGNCCPLVLHVMHVHSETPTVANSSTTQYCLHHSHEVNIATSAYHPLSCIFVASIFSCQVFFALQRLPASAPQLVAASPSVTEDGGLMLGSLQSSVYVVNARTGSLLSMLAPDATNAKAGNPSGESAGDGQV